MPSVTPSSPPALAPSSSPAARLAGAVAASGAAPWRRRPRRRSGRRRPGCGPRRPRPRPQRRGGKSRLPTRATWSRPALARRLHEEDRAAAKPKPRTSPPPRAGGGVDRSGDRLNRISPGESKAPKRAQEKADAAGAAPARSRERLGGAATPPPPPPAASSRRSGRRSRLCGNQPVRQVHLGNDAAVMALSSGEEQHRHAIEQASRRWRGGQQRRFFKGK